jgi:hypothetical protein
MLEMHSLNRYMSVTNLRHVGGVALATSSVKSGATDLNQFVVFDAACRKEASHGPATASVWVSLR